MVIQRTLRPIKSRLIIPPQVLLLIIGVALLRAPLESLLLRVIWYPLPQTLTLKPLLFKVGTHRQVLRTTAINHIISRKVRRCFDNSDLLLTLLRLLIQRVIQREVLTRLRRVLLVAGRGTRTSDYFVIICIGLL